MRIVSWNCCLKLTAKYEHVAQLKPDILIVQECEQLAQRVEAFKNPLHPPQEQSVTRFHKIRQRVEAFNSEAV